MKSQVIIIFLLFTIFGCTRVKNKLADLFKDTDMIILERLTNTDTLFYTIKDKKGIKIFTDIIDGRQYNIPHSEKIGEMLFFSNGKLLFKAAITKDGIEYNFKNELYKGKMSYQSGMYFSEVWNNSLEKKK